MEESQTRTRVLLCSRTELEACTSRFSVSRRILNGTVNMERLQWDGLESLATSSPKKRNARTKSILPPAGKNIALDELKFEFSERELRNQDMLPSVRSSIQKSSESALKQEDSQKVTSFEKNNSSVDRNGNSNTRESDLDSSEEEVVDLTSSSVKSEAETTIQKVKEFIESKRKALKEDANQTLPKSSSSKKVLKGQTRRPADYAKRPTVALSQHRKTLRRLIHRIHKLPYNSEWSVEEWHLLQEYLNEWRLSGDDDMFQPVVLNDLFNCTVAELEIRVGSLKKFVHWKKRRARGGNMGA